MVERIFSFKMSNSLIMGAGAVSKLGDIVRIFHKSNWLIVTDPGIVKAGLVDKVRAPLVEAGAKVDIYDGVEPDPKTEVVADCAAKAKAAKAEVMLGLGGGSSLDIAKTAALIVKHAGPIQEYFGIGKTPGRGIPTVLLPTTAGTGSEVTPIAVLSDKAESLKKAVVSDDLYPDIALVDPELMITTPASVTGYTGMDALTHAIEAFTNRHALHFIDTLALEAIRLIGKHLRRAVGCGEDIEARSAMALSSTLGGMCLGAVNTAAVHALAYPLGGTFDVPHGVANSLLLPYVMEYNVPADLAKYARIAEALGQEVEGLSLREAAFESVRAVKELAMDIRVPQRMRDLGIPREAIPDMAAGAIKVTRLLNNNPRKVQEEDARQIYEQAY